MLQLAKQEKLEAYCGTSSFPNNPDILYTLQDIHTEILGMPFIFICMHAKCM